MTWHVTRNNKIQSKTNHVLLIKSLKTTAGQNLINLIRQRTNHNCKPFENVTACVAYSHTHSSKILIMSLASGPSLTAWWRAVSSCGPDRLFGSARPFSKALMHASRLFLTAAESADRFSGSKQFGSAPSCSSCFTSSGRPSPRGPSSLINKRSSGCIKAEKNLIVT